jgi:hypothetical protein
MEQSKLKIKFWVGWLTSQLTIFELGNLWYNNAQAAEKQNAELVVFQIPKGDQQKYNEAIAEIEKLLQDKFQNQSWEEKNSVEFERIEMLNEAFLKVFLIGK